VLSKLLPLPLVLWLQHERVVHKEDLARIHDVTHGNFALESAPGIPNILEPTGKREGLVADLGCGSGLWTQELTKARYGGMPKKGEAELFSGNNHVEFIDGKIAEMTANGWWHAQYVTRLDMSLARFADERALAGRH
jgi:SAM-dependent methyltransferase